jgi:hypothetical protein
MATANYVGSFGSTDYHPCLTNAIGVDCTGDGVFFLNSRISAADVRDGMTYTILVGERRTDKDTTPARYATWIGAPPGGVESLGRVLGVADYPPNDPAKHFEGYSSNHAGGVAVGLCDGSVHFINELVDAKLFAGMGTIRKLDDTPPFQQP